jgi:hypothetical protein
MGWGGVGVQTVNEVNSLHSLKKRSQEDASRRKKNKKIKAVRKQKGQLEIENEYTDTEFCEKHKHPDGGSSEGIKTLYQTEGLQYHADV